MAKFVVEASLNGFLFWVFGKSKHLNNIKTLVLILLDFLYYHTTKILCFHFFL